MIEESAIRYGFKLISDKYKVIDAWTTYRGSWEPSSNPWSVTRRIREKYLLPWGHPEYHYEAGGDHHVFIKAYDSNGTPKRSPISLYNGYKDSPEKLAEFHPKANSNWANQPVWLSTLGNGIPSKLLWAIDRSMVIMGGGMPKNEHVSLFVVVQEKTPLSEPDAPSEISIDVSGVSRLKLENVSDELTISMSR